MTIVVAATGLMARTVATDDIDVGHTVGQLYLVQVDCSLNAIVYSSTNVLLHEQVARGLALLLWDSDDRSHDTTQLTHQLEPCALINLTLRVRVGHLRVVVTCDRFTGNS